MASTTFIPGTVVTAAWLNEINDLVHEGTFPSSQPTLTFEREAWAPTQWPSINGSLGDGAINVDYTRSGGYGSYGVLLSQYLVTDSVGATEFDVGITSWASASNFGATGASLFGMWAGANSPSSELGQVYSGGAAIGMEINAGNRWADFGLQTDIGGTRYTVGLQVVPDIVPAKDGESTTTYPGSFGIVIAPSVSGHKWWVASFIRQNTVMPDGFSQYFSGGSTNLLAPAAILKAPGYYKRGFDFSETIFENQAILFSADQIISWGGATINGNATDLGISTDSTGLGGLYGNNYAQASFLWASSGSAPKIGFYGTTPIVKPTVSGDRSDGTALTNLLTTLANLGLITDGTVA